jgi:hypothetical protein
MPKTPREPVTIGRERGDVWEETVGKAPPDDEDSWTFNEFRHAMWQWLNFDDAPEYFSANDLADDGLPRMKHLGGWLAQLASLGWIDRPRATLPGIDAVFYCVETNNPTNRSVVTVWRNLRPAARGLRQ